mgnify:CR=1 FL=1
MAPFLSEEDEPPPLDVEGLVAMSLECEANGGTYSGLVVKEAQPFLGEEGPLYQIVLSEPSGLYVTDEDLTAIEDVAGSVGSDFSEALLRYQFDPPSLENDELAVDRELMDDAQRALLPYFRDAARRVSQGEYRTFQRLLQYHAA